MKNGTNCLPMAPFVVLVVLSGQFSNHFLEDLRKLISEDDDNLIFIQNKKEAIV
ncbi:hypothetical protein [Sphingobacterium endophyticum]|uniref:hypothetical protein n=1 Tax=Sphingobacterium endophyticum TaxID=2546448 RepID=UPI0012E2830C|nr:hypothetical protein [Sphingobacterium endophyticum]